MELKETLHNKFGLIYPNCDLYAISHYSYKGHLVASVFYKDTSGKRHIETFDNQSNDCHANYIDEGGNYESLNNFQVVNLFSSTTQTTNQTNWFDYTAERWI